MSRALNCLDLELNCTKLNDRELQILYLIANGKTISNVASLLFLSPNTIKAAISVILKKLNVQNRAEAVYLLAEGGYLNQDGLLFKSFVNEI